MLTSDKLYNMEELIKNWEKRMNAYRLEADTTKSNIQSVKAMHNFMTLRDCVKELKQQLILSVVKQSEQLPTAEELENGWKDLENSGLDKKLKKWD
jgi:Tfp pilus assembly protein PilO